MKNNLRKYKNSLKKKENFCTICKKVILGNNYKFNSHLHLHNAVESRFICPYCLKGFYRGDMYNKHVAEHTGEKKNKRKYICDYCDRSFVEKRNLILHLKVHDDSLIQHPNLQYKCLACGVVYYEERLLKYHIRRNHYNLVETEPVYLKKPLNDTWVEAVINTEECVQMTKVNNNLLMIKRYVKKDDKKNCNSKDVQDNTKKNVHSGNHYMNKSEKVHDEFNIQHKTDTINTRKGKNFKERNVSFSNYLRSVFASKDRSYYSKAICDYCNKEMLKKSLKSHIRERHLNIRKFNCNQCKENFKRHYQLVNHVCGKFKQRKRKQVDKKCSL